MLSCLVFHFFVLKINRQLLDLKAVFVADIMCQATSKFLWWMWSTGASLHTILSLMIIRKWYFSMRLIRWNFCTTMYLVHIQCVYILWMVISSPYKLFLPLSWVNDSSLHFRFLPRTGSSACHSASVRRIGIKIVARPGECRQSTLLVEALILKWFVYSG